jgi:glycosyltransferase involved in cell wall biosynthesis
VRIVWICGARVAGGAERATAQVLALLRARGHDVTVRCPDGGRLPALLAELALPMRPAPLGGALNLRARAAIADTLATAVADAVLVTTADEWVWSCLARRPPGTRLVLARHMALPLARRVRWLAGRRADAVIAVSEAVRASLSAWPAIAPARLHVVHNPVRFAPRAAPPSPAERRLARAEMGLPEAGALVGFFGGLGSAKGAADVAHALRIVNQQRETHLLLCGPPVGGAPPPAALASAFDLVGRIHDGGQRDDMARALTAADLVVMATHSRLGEALPATLIEAMACGTPVAAYAHSGMAEVIGEDQGAGLLARADDPDDLARVISESLADPIAAARRATTALARVAERFDPARAATRYEAVLSGIA